LTGNTGSFAARRRRRGSLNYCMFWRRIFSPFSLAEGPQIYQKLIRGVPMFCLNCFRFNSARFSGVRHFWTRVISGFRCEVDENCALQVYNEESSGNSLPTFRDKLSVSSSRMNFSSPLKLRPIGCPESSARY